MEMVVHFKIMDITKNILTVVQETTGAYVLTSSATSYKSPLMQYLALYFLISPSGDLLTWNTQVPGRILDLASEIGTSTHMPLASRAEISACAVSIPLDLWTASHMASSQENRSGSLALPVALKAKGFTKFKFKYGT